MCKIVEDLISEEKKRNRFKNAKRWKVEKKKKLRIILI